MTDIHLESGSIHLGIVHYHLWRGGVCTVILNQLRALIAASDGRHCHIDLISSDACSELGHEFCRTLQEWAANSGYKGGYTLRPVQIEAVGYNDEPAPNRATFLRESEELAGHVLAALTLPESDGQEPYMLIAHNGNLGKNPRLTCALKLLAERFEQQQLPAWLLHQVHDFAEDNRPACWRALRDCCGSSDSDFAVGIMYPTGSRVRWACINTADQQRLHSVGIPADRVSVLNNAVDVEEFSAKPLARMSSEELGMLGLQPVSQPVESDTAGLGPVETNGSGLDVPDYRGQLKQRLADYARQNGYVFEADRKILCSPIKVIRRKNVAESVLLLLLLNRHCDEYQLLVTLRANSPADMAYCLALEDFVKAAGLAVVIGFGHELLRPGSQRHIVSGRVEAFSLVDLLDISTAAITTSVQEGFGYVFHEPWLAGRPVIGRNIPRVTRDFTANQMNLEHLYDHLLIPKVWLMDRWDELCSAYWDKAASMRQTAGLPTISQAEVRRLLDREKTFRTTGNPAPMLDWADLAIDMQFDLLKTFVDEPDRLDEISLATCDLLPIQCWHPGEYAGIIEENCGVVAASYNLAATAGQLQQLRARAEESLGLPVAAQDSPCIDNSKIFADCLDIAKLRLLTA